MKNKLTNMNHFTVAIIFFITLGLIGCNGKDDPRQRIRVQDFIKKEVVDGNLSLRNKLNMEKIEIKPCGNEHKNECPSVATGFKRIGSQDLKVTVTAFQKKSNSVDCYIIIRIPGYPPIPAFWHEKGNKCSAGQQV